MPQIVTINVSLQVAPSPNTLQQTAALVSTGGTTLPAGADALLTQLSDLTPLLTKSSGLAGAPTFANGVVTFNIVGVFDSNYQVGDQVQITFMGFVPTSLNGTYTYTIASQSSFTLAGQSAAPTITTSGQIIPTATIELTQMATTLFAQGNSTSVYVLELGGHVDNPASGPGALASWITANPAFFYAYLIPRLWDEYGSAGLLSLLSQYEADTAETYFFITTTASTYSQYSDLQKCAFTLIEAPTAAAGAGVPTATEFSCAAPFYNFISQQPSAVSKIAPFNNQFVSGVTPYPTKGNSAFLATLAAANVNVIGTGQQGGIANALITPGTFMDGNDASFWYSVDWFQINLNLDLANAVINGSNNEINPLYFSQPGIVDLQGVAQQTATNGITFGALLGPVTVNAIPFNTYVIENPSDFKTGTYRGLSCTAVPNRGFSKIIFQLVISQFPSGGAVS